MRKSLMHKISQKLLNKMFNALEIIDVKIVL